MTTMESSDQHPGSKTLRSRWIWLLLTAVIVLAGAKVRLSGARADAPAATDSSNPGLSAADTAAVPHRILAYYFHTTYRCASCRKLEAYAREAVETGFPEALKDGRLVWQMVNVETKGNGHFVKDYRLFTKAVVLVDQRSGREDRWKSLNKIWQLLGDKQEFVKYVQEETRAYLTDAP